MVQLQVTATITLDDGVRLDDAARTVFEAFDKADIRVQALGVGEVKGSK